MNQSKWDNSLIRTVVRLIFLSKFIFFLIVLILALIIGIISTKSLQRSLKTISHPAEKVNILEKGITNLYEADNNFRLFSLTLNRTYFEEYQKNLQAVSGVIDSLDRQKFESENIYSLDTSLQNKSRLQTNYLQLKILLDSLLALSSNLGSREFPAYNLPTYSTERYSRIKHRYDSDSVIESKGSEKKSFFNKLKDLFKDEPGKAGNRQVISTSKENIDSVASPLITHSDRMLLKDIHLFYLNNYLLFADGTKRLNQEEFNLLKLNSSIIKSFKQLLETIKDQEISIAQSIRSSATQSARSSSNWLIIIAGITFLIATIMFLLILSNLQKIKSISRSLQKAKDDAENLAGQKSTFLRNMSHEIRAPLNNIIGFTEQLSQQELPPDQKTLLMGINTSSDMLLTTVNQILDFSKLENGKMVFQCRNFNPISIINEVADTNALRANQKGISIRKEFDTRSRVLVNGDEFRLKQVVTNLVDNAIKYSESGEITLNALIERTRENGYRLRVFVADNGIGIPEDQLSRIFIEFNRIEDQSPRSLQTGTGLGLTICQKIIEQLNGKIEVKSDPGHGSVFSFEIPYSEARGETKEQKTVLSADRTILAGKKILLAEDDEFSQLLVRNILLKQKVQLVIAGNGEEAFSRVLSDSFDLILTDINMSGMDGFDLIKNIRQSEHPNIASLKVIAITANVMEPELKQILSAGMNGYILKPFREKELLDRVAAELTDNKIESAPPDNLN